MKREYTLLFKLLKAWIRNSSPKLEKRMKLLILIGNYGLRPSWINRMKYTTKVAIHSLVNPMICNTLLTFIHFILFKMKVSYSL
jgi:hypothetical protein